MKERAGFVQLVVSFYPTGLERSTEPGAGRR